MTRRIRITSLALSLAVTIALAGCGGGGGGDDDSAERQPDESSTTAEATGDSTTTAPAAGGAPPAPGAPGDVGTQLEVDRTFTGEGSEGFCGQVRALQESVSGTDPSRIDEATVTGQMAALTPPAEIAPDWNLMVSVQESMTDSPDDPFAGIDQAQLDAYGLASAVIAAYLGDVCQLSLIG
jgi:hypothetical protein